MGKPCYIGENDMGIDAFCFTARGGRRNNEDSAAFRLNQDKGLFVVADGLGGHAMGEVASACAVEVLLNGWEESFQNRNIPRPQWLYDKLREANQTIIALQRSRGGNMKSTAVALAVEDNKACWIHTGDSRLYYISRGEIRHITEDQSVAYKKYLAGEITRLQINTDEDQSALLRSLGNSDRFEPISGQANLEEGDAFLLCSDGIWEYLHDMEILVDYLKSQSAREWGSRLLRRVMDRVDGENDNLSLITVLTGAG